MSLINSHANMRVIVLGTRRCVVEVIVKDYSLDTFSFRRITIIGAPGLAPVAESLARKVAEELSWQVGYGSISSFGPPLCSSETINRSTGNGRFRYTEFCR